jgi:bifunctional non-homologous end joining protein LigD
MGISVPLDWSEVAQLKELPQWSLANYAQRLEAGNAPWRDYERSRQGLARAMRALADAGAGGARSRPRR